MKPAPTINCHSANHTVGHYISHSTNKNVYLLGIGTWMSISIKQLYKQNYWNENEIWLINKFHIINLENIKSISLQLKWKLCWYQNEYMPS